MFTHFAWRIQELEMSSLLLFVLVCLCIVPADGALNSALGTNAETQSYVKNSSGKSRSFDLGAIEVDVCNRCGFFSCPTEFVPDHQYDRGIPGATSVLEPLVDIDLISSLETRCYCPGFDTCLSQAGPGRQLPTIPDAPQC